MARRGRVQPAEKSYRQQARTGAGARSLGVHLPGPLPLSTLQFPVRHVRRRNQNPIPSLRHHLHYQQPQNHQAPPVPHDLHVDW
ncbi:hypothetical protein BC938DRAFT_478273 [Jimgerdemannia flammicorona]|uniref:Uncharacterized protein n=1 Tax=Jimgerdemannia flammicorona TaxID=994334 RepID=A0A433QN51_9FUNG|nr:hypothetical protein BC938DRAFT_478273 [Jimgerdemannia flammicorona]